MKVRGLSDFRLKIIGLGFVILAGLGTAFVQKGMPADLGQADFGQLTAAVLLEALSWIVFPIYAWLLYSGFTHTGSVYAYGGRLLLLAAVSEVPYDLATSGKPWDMSSQNPVFALVVILVVLSALKYLTAGPRTRAIIGSAVIIIAGILWMLLLNIGSRLGLMPGGVVMLLFVVIFYFLNGRDNTMNLVGCVVGALAGIFPAFGLVILHFRNNEPVSTPAARRAFYIAYPACLLLIGLLGRWL